MSTLPNPPNGGYWYGNATSLIDAAGITYIAGIAAYDNLPKSDPARFRFSVFRINAGAVLTYVPIEDAGNGLNGAGMIYVRASDGHGRYSCTSNKVDFDGPIPGFVPFPSALSLQSQIAQIHQTIMALPPTTTNPVVRIPAAGGKEGGEIQLAPGNATGNWVIDCYDGKLRFIHDNVLIDHWPK